MKKITTRAAALMLAAMLAVLPLSACGQKQTESERFAEFTHEAFVGLASSDYLSTHFLMREPAAYGVTDVPKTLGRFDWDHIKEGEKELAQTQKQLEEFRYSELTADQQLTHDVLTDFLAIQRKFDGFTFYQEPNTTTGIQSSLPILLAEFRFYSAADVDDYLTLLEDVDNYFENMLQFQQERSKQGLFMTDALADEVIKGIRDFAQATEDHYMFSTFDDRVAALPELTQKQRDDYSARNRDILQKTVLPGFAAFADGLEALKGTGVGDGSLARLPEGTAYYEALVAYSTGSTRSVKEMDAWLDELISTCYGDVSALFLTNPDAAQYGLEELMEEDIAISDPAEIVTELQEKIAAEFTPLENVQYQLKTVHPAMQEGLSPAFYLTPPIDAEAENPIYTNPFYMNQSTNMYLYTTLAHEGFPGHLYESNFFTRTNPDPVRLAINFSGFSEGWGTYAEMLSYEFAPLDHAAAGTLQRINQELILLLYCKTDIGVHYYGWDVEALGDFVEDMGYNRGAAPELFQAVAGNPANYLSYGVGYFEFKELRQQAEHELGNAFSATEFHDMLLSAGPATFGVLATQTERFIAEKTASVASGSTASAGSAPAESASEQNPSSLAAA